MRKWLVHVTTQNLKYVLLIGYRGVPFLIKIGRCTRNFLMEELQGLQGMKRVNEVRNLNTLNLIFDVVLSVHSIKFIIKF